MKILLFRAEKEIIHFLVCEIKENTIETGEKEKISLEAANSKGEKYQLIINDLHKLLKKHSPKKFIYRSGQAFRGKIDEIRYANEAILNYFAYTNKIEIEELTQTEVRKKLGLKTPEFKTLIEKETKHLIETENLSKSDKILESLVFLSALYTKKLSKY